MVVVATTALRVFGLSQKQTFGWFEKLARVSYGEQVRSLLLCVPSVLLSFMTLVFEFNFVVRQNMHLISNSLHEIRHFCFDANPYPTGRRGLRRNRNVWRAASSELSHYKLESTVPNKSPEPTAVGTCRSAVAVRVASRRWLSFFR
jgi:hypothetical protein